MQSIFVEKKRIFWVEIEQCQNKDEVGDGRQEGADEEAVEEGCQEEEDGEEEEAAEEVGEEDGMEDETEDSGVICIIWKDRVVKILLR